MVLLPLPLGEGWGEGIVRLLRRCAWFEAGAGMSSRQPSHFLLLRQKKVTKEKATPLAATLRFATGNLRCSLFAGSAQTRCAQTRAALIREKLRASARAEGSGTGHRCAGPPTASLREAWHRCVRMCMFKCASVSVSA